MNATILLTILITLLVVMSLVLLWKNFWMQADIESLIEHRTYQQTCNSDQFKRIAQLERNANNKVRT